MINKTTSLLCALLLTVVSYGQTYSFSNQSEVSVEGTSNVHDWSAVVEQINASGNWNQALSNLRVEFVVESMASGDRLMDKRIHKTLNAEDHPKIIFEVVDSSRNGADMTLVGDLTINGVKKRITVQAKVETLPDGKLKVIGSHPVLFTDHGMEAPSFMFGAMKVGDQVTIKFNVIVTQ